MRTGTLRWASDKELYAEIGNLRGQISYYQRALMLVCRDLPMDVFTNGDFKEIAAMLAKRIDIASSALNGKPLPKQIEVTPEEEKNDEPPILSSGDQVAEGTAETSEPSREAGTCETQE